MMTRSLLAIAIISLHVARTQGQFMSQPIFPRLQCFIRMALLGFEIRNFDKYGDYFQADSVMELAQAGQYIGTEAIEEYVKFVIAEFSPYYAEASYLDEKLTYLGFEDGNCVFATAYDTEVAMNANVTNAIAGSSYRVINMVKLYYNFESRYIKDIFVFFTTSYITDLFEDMLFGGNTRDFVCGVIDGPCNGFLDSAPADCLAELAELPATTDDGRFDGNSQGCRALHAVFAAENPLGHCPHISFQPQEDENGKIKCQVSANREPEDLFDEADMQLFRDYCIARGIDPVKAHTYTRGE